MTGYCASEFPARGKACCDEIRDERRHADAVVPHMAGFQFGERALAIAAVDEGWRLKVRLLL